MAFQVAQHHLLKGFSFLHCVFLVPLSKIIPPTYVVLFMDSQICFIGLCVCFSPHTMLFWLPLLSSIEYNLKSDSVMPLALFFFFSGLLWLFGSFVVSYKSEYFLFYFFKKAFEISIGITLNLCIALGNMAILTILILPIHKYGISFYFVVSFSIYFNNTL